MPDTSKIPQKSSNSIIGKYNSKQTYTYIKDKTFTYNCSYVIKLIEKESIKDKTKLCGLTYLQIYYITNKEKLQPILSIAFFQVSNKFGINLNF